MMITMIIIIIISIYINMFSISILYSWQVFIGGRNRLYQLSPDLNIVATAITGPKNVSNECLFGKCPPNQPRNPTDNINKVLLIDYATSRLIACGSIGQGYCNVVNLQNVSIVEKEIQEAVVANNESTYCILCSVCFIHCDVLILMIIIIFIYVDVDVAMWQ